MLWLCYAYTLPITCHGDKYMDSGSAAKPNLPETMSRTQTYLWGYAIRMPRVRYGSAVDPLSAMLQTCCYGCATHENRRNMLVLWVCARCDGYALDVPWVDFCIILKTDVVWMCYVYANRLPMMCYGDGYNDSGPVEKPNLQE